MKILETKFDFSLTFEQIKILRKTNPVLLTQAAEYGYEVHINDEENDEFLFYNQPEKIKLNISSLLDNFE